MTIKPLEAQGDAHLSVKCKYIYTIAASFCQLVYGLMYEITGATLADMADQTGTTFNVVSYAITVRTIGYLLGSLMSGFAYSRVNRQLGYMIALILSAVISVCIPFEDNIITYFGSLFLTGCFGAAMDVAGNAWILEIWQESANPYMQAQLVSYAIGQALIPFISAPFLNDSGNRTIAFMFSRSMFDHSTYEITPNHPQTSMIIVPYTIAAVFGFLGAIMLLALFCKMPYRQVSRSIVKSPTVNNLPSISVVNVENHIEKQEEPEQAAKIAQPDRYHVSVMILGCLLLCVYNGIELNCLNFVPTYVENLSIPVTKSKAAIMLSTLSAFYALSRGVCFFIGSRISTNHVVYYNMVMIAVGNALLIAFANMNEPMIWVSLMMMGFGFGSTFPALLSLFEEKINVTNQLSGWLMFSSNISVIVNSLLVGKMIEYYPQVFVYINVISLLICCFLLAGLYFNEYKNTKRHNDIAGEGHRNVVSYASCESTTTTTNRQQNVNNH